MESFVNIKKVLNENIKVVKRNNEYKLFVEMYNIKKMCGKAIKKKKVLFSGGELSSTGGQLSSAVLGTTCLVDEMF